MLDKSPSSRRAWIEIAVVRQSANVLRVALLAEGVDRNGEALYPGMDEAVALLAEGVDRNQKPLDKIEKVWCRPPRGGRG